MPEPEDAVMNELREMGEEMTVGMSAAQMQSAADELEAIARIIRQQACSACEFCKRPFCSRPGLPWLN